MSDLRGLTVPRSEEIETSSKSKFIAAAVVAVGIAAIGVYTYASNANAPAMQKVAVNQPFTPPAPAPMTPAAGSHAARYDSGDDAGTAGAGAAADRIDALDGAGRACRAREDSGDACRAGDGACADAAYHGDRSRHPVAERDA